jgi:2-amino-4-hydroxy-6-hydroxymethyldihydropteridine diphosphokinase
MESLSRRGEILACSSAYETSPVDMQGVDDPFLNCALRYRTYLDPRALLRFLKDIEEHAGRDLAERSQPRTLDIDIISWSGGEWRDEYLDIPHPRAQERLFVLVPYNEICTEGAGGFEPFPELAIQGAAQKIEFYCGSDMLCEHPEEIGTEAIGTEEIGTEEIGTEEIET